MQKENFHIAKIIASYLSGEINKDNEEILDNWLGKSDANKLLFEKIIGRENRKLKQENRNKYNKGVAWVKLQNDISSRKIRDIRINVLKYAAIFFYSNCHKCFYFFD